MVREMSHKWSYLRFDKSCTTPHVACGSDRARTTAEPGRLIRQALESTPTSPDSTTVPSKFVEGEEVFSHAKDGKYYLGTVVEVRRRRCRDSCRAVSDKVVCYFLSASLSVCVCYHLCHVFRENQSL